MFKAASFTMAKTLKQRKCLSMDEWISTVWYIHTMEYYLALQGKEILTYSTAVKAEDITLNKCKISQSQKDKYYIVPFI